MALSVDINCDMGESFGPFRMGEDDTVLESISSAKRLAKNLLKF